MITATQGSKGRVECDRGYEVLLEIFSTEEEEQLVFRDWPAHIAAEHLAGIWIGLSTRKLGDACAFIASIPESLAMKVVPARSRDDVDHSLCTQRRGRRNAGLKNL